jgi:hypothetical protein
MIYLYVKRLPTGLFYLGKTEQDLNIYLGSGNNWLKEIKQNNFTIKDIEKLKGPKSEEHKNKLKNPKKKSKCLYCQTYVDGGNMKRWHGKDRCTVKK